MTTDPFLLFHEWDLLSEHAIPPLRRAETAGHRPRVWAAGEVADAVAVAVAYRQEVGPGGVDGTGMEAYASGSPGPVYFSRSQMRCLPQRSRSELFRRCQGGWQADEVISRSIVMGEPRRPVDLIVLRRDGRGSDDTGRPVEMLRSGGRLMLVEAGRPDRSADLDGRLGGLRQLDHLQHR